MNNFRVYITQNLLCFQLILLKYLILSTLSKAKGDRVHENINSTHHITDPENKGNALAGMYKC